VSESALKEEPLWRSILNWGCVVYFLGLPGVALFYGMMRWSFVAGSDIPKFLSDFHFAVSALLAAVAGLNSFDRYKANGKSIVKPKATTP
jgi:hypothetical protein